ncbi:hypothetical protein [Vibrio tasmaniensis]|uniref:hypothetical protein n=1 Tax=Vibrio tasmaniensis TaxID=212663 RepID=UPI00107EF7A8|nr:hypothetical protein [Vibrio tasmaniensis]
MNEIDANIFGALGTWFSGVITFFTLIYLIIQNSDVKKRQMKLERKQNKLWKHQKEKMKFEIYQDKKREFIFNIEKLEEKYKNRYIIHDKKMLFEQMGFSGKFNKKKDIITLPQDHKLNILNALLDNCFEYIKSDGITSTSNKPPTELDTIRVNNLFIDNTEQLIEHLNITINIESDSSSPIYDHTDKIICDLIMPYETYVFSQDLFDQITYSLGFDSFKTYSSSKTRELGYINIKSSTVSGLNHFDFTIRECFLTFYQNEKYESSNYYKYKNIKIAEKLQSIQHNPSIIKKLEEDRFSLNIKTSELEKKLNDLTN